MTIKLLPFLDVCILAFLLCHTCSQNGGTLLVKLKAAIFGFAKGGGLTLRSCLNDVQLNINKIIMLPFNLQD